MVYNDPATYGALWITQSSNGLNWSNTSLIAGQWAQGCVALAPLKDKLIMVYRSAFDSQLWVSEYNGTTWDRTAKIENQTGNDPTITPVGNYLYLVYSDANNNNQLYITRSLDGFTWTDTQRIDGQLGIGPSLEFFQQRQLVLVYSDGIGNGQLWVTQCTPLTT